MNDDGRKQFHYLIANLLWVGLVLVCILIAYAGIGGECA
jgi:hypothetical protein